jgi:DNA (cytosine-5)-methyltransferase 1
LHKLRTGHLFAGAGGGILADLLLGHQPIFAVEIEDYPRKVLEQRQADGVLPFFPTFGDIREFDGTPWRGTVDVLCGGFPCQDISAAGKGAGITGARSGLWKEYARLIGEMRPRFVFAENSPLLRTRGLGVVLQDLAALGYNARWGIIGAGDVGAPHKRDRMWVLAYTNNARLQGRKGKGCSGEERQPARYDSECSSLWWHTDPASISYTTSQRRRCGNSRREDAEDAGQLRGGERKDPRGMEEGDFEPAVGRVAHGVANRVDRLKAIGNGQVSLCAAVAFNILSEGLI